jgi:hypothetical protein
MAETLVTDAVVVFLTSVGPNPAHLHAAGALLASQLRREPPGDAAFASGISGRRWAPWSDEDMQRDPPNPRMTTLAERFPSLRRGPGVAPWKPYLLDNWACAASSEERRAASFLLWVVWNPTGPWRVEPFNICDAWTEWDEDHRDAAMSWLQAPFHP